MKLMKALVGATAICSATTVGAVDLEVTHWWTSGGEAAAVAELAKAFNEKTEQHWVDGAIAGSGGVARPIMISRIIGGDPMGATQFNHGRQAEELVEAGLMLDLTDIAEAEGWRDIVNPVSLLDVCTIDGRIYCAPVNIHSWQWLWLSHKAFADAGIAGANATGTNSSPPLQRWRPLARSRWRIGQQSWQSTGAFQVMAIAIAGQDAWSKVYIDKDADAAAGPGIRQGVRGCRERARICGEIQRSGLEPGHQSGHHRCRLAARSWATGRKASFRSPARWPARTTPACRVWA